MEPEDNLVDKYCHKSKPFKDHEFESFEKKVDEISQLLADFKSKDYSVSTAAFEKATALLKPSGSNDELEKGDAKVKDTNPGVTKVGDPREEMASEDPKLASVDPKLGSGDTKSCTKNPELGAGDSKSCPNKKDIHDTKVRVKKNKTVINQKAFDNFYEKKGPATMSQDAFMKSVEEDAKRRFEDKEERKAKAEKFKKLGNQAFQRGEHEEALVHYDRAIEHIVDSPLLYTNRALANLRLELYVPAMLDAEKALRLDEHNLKAHLYKARCMFHAFGSAAGEEYVESVKEKFPSQRKMIETYRNTYFVDQQTHLFI